MALRRIHGLTRLAGRLALPILALAWLAGCGSSENSSGGGDSVNAEPTSLSSKQPDPHPKVQFRTTHGDITVELDAEKAPLTVENFLSYVESGHYDSTIFHHVRRGDVVMGGGYTQQLEAKSQGPTIRNEAHNGLNNVRGTIAMARQANIIDSSTCQFYFNLADNRDYLDPKPSDNPQMLKPEEYGYCVFGKVIAGLEVLDQISEVEVRDNGDSFDMLPLRAVMIKTARRVK
jgi:cyclophilin family peptidyl-prolyl cis-trans isomerase